MPEQAELRPGSAAAASHTMVSAPSSAVRRMVAVTEANPGIDPLTPGVAAQPGCMACTTGSVGRVNSAASNSASATCIRLVRA